MVFCFNFSVDVDPPLKEAAKILAMSVSEQAPHMHSDLLKRLHVFGKQSQERFSDSFSHSSSPDVSCSDRVRWVSCSKIVPVFTVTVHLL